MRESAEQLEYPPDGEHLEHRPSERPASSLGGEVVERLFYGCEARLGRFLAQMVGNRALAEDLLQDTFCEAFRCRDQLHDPLHGASISPNPPKLTTGATSTLACNLIGQTASQTETALHQNGYQIEWRFQHWGNQPVQHTDKNAPSGVTDYSSEPQTVPANSVVWDIGADTRSANTFFVFVEARNDPNAPTLTPRNCHGG